MGKAKLINLDDKKYSTQGVSAAWSFNLNPVEGWAFCEKALSKNECEEIIKLGSQKKLTRGTIGTETETTDARTSDQCWLFPTDGLDWFYRRMTDVILDINSKYFNFDLFGLNEGMQFTKYSAPGGKYGRHVDHWVGGLVRKLSFSIQLTDPKEYEGGDLHLHFGDKPVVMKRDLGYMAVFPSYVLHEVTPVTKGTRYSLVSWVTGKPFK